MNQLAIWLASKPRKRPPSTVVLHATAGSSLSGALSTLRLRNLSYHVLIEKDGSITKCVPYRDRVAYHAGKSIGPEGPWVNSYSIGISLVNKNDGQDPYPAAQVEACRKLVRELAADVPCLKWITTHAAVSPGRKTDPRRFPTAAVAGRLEVWP